MILLWALTGAALGSFLNVVIDRLPRGGSLLHPPSHCDACGRRLRPTELIPILSYLLLRGRCRACHAPVPRRVVLVEVATAALFGFLRWRYGATPQFLYLGFYLSLFLVLALIDLEHRLILNRLVYPAAVLALLATPFYPDLDLQLSRFWPVLAGGALAFGLFLAVVLIYPAGMGWGDVKMAGLIGLTTGFPVTLIALFIAFIAGGLIAAALLLLRRRRWGQAIPYGPFLALGAGLALLWGQPLWDLYTRLLRP